MQSDAPTSLSNATLAPGRSPRLLGHAGLLPFVGLAIAVGLSREPVRSQAAFALLAYGASILSFLGAIHWGLAMREHGHPPATRWVWGVLPSLLAWVALLLGAAPGLWLLAASLWACWAVDRSVYPRFSLQSWLPMRLGLTAIASLCCVAGALSFSTPI